MNGPRPLPEFPFRIILDSIADGVFTVDLDFRITSFNRAAEEITGIPRAEALGQRCSRVFQTDVCRNGCMLRQAIQGNRPLMNMPVHIVRADGGRIPISASGALLRNETGGIIGGVETFRDLTAVKRLQRELRNLHSFEDIVSKNEKMLRLFSILPQIAKSDSTVLILGSSGTGKELVARAIHNNSSMRKGPFVAINCGALPDTLCESELFGYKAGAFTDAKRDKPGRFALAQNGTLFLDEIGDISQAVQMRLLRVLEERVYEPLGSTRTIPTNARVIAATHRNLEDLVEQGIFREDLYFRINVIRLTLPPLRERREDIPLLVEHFVERNNHLRGRNLLGPSQDAMAALMLYDWPGNVRELGNAIEHAFVLCQDELIRVQHLPERILPDNDHMVVPRGLTLKEIERQAIAQALQRNQLKRVATARELGVDKNTLRRKILRLGIRVPP